MKKFLSVIIIVLLLSALVSCNNSNDKTVVCNSCGEKISVSSVFCQFCGAALKNQGNLNDDNSDDINSDKYDSEESSLGLDYMENDDGTYSVVGMGSCTDRDLVITTHNGQKVTELWFNGLNEYPFVESIYIGDSVRKMFDWERGAFGLVEFTNLKRITVSKNNATLKSVDGNLYSKDGTAFVQYASGKTDKSFSFPDGVEKIGPWAFCTANLENIVLPNSLKSIMPSAFICENLVYNSYDNALYLGDDSNKYLALVAPINDGNGIKDCKIADKTKIIVGLAFAYCADLTSVTIPDSVTSIGDSAFLECISLTSVTIGKGVTSIASDAFLNCHKLVEVINHSSLNITAGSSDYGYAGYYAKEVHSGESKIVNYNDYLFYTYGGGNYLLGYVGSDTDIVLPESYNGGYYEIYDFAFQRSYNIRSIAVPDSVTSIGKNAFGECLNLVRVTIGNGVIKIGSNAFEGCYGLASVTIGSSVQSFDYTALYTVSGKLVEVINHSALDIKAGNDLIGPEVNHIKEVHTGESKIVNYNDYLFYTFKGVNYLLGYVGNDTALVLPESYNAENYEIYNYAFYERDDITSIIIPDSVTSIGDGAFQFCYSLTVITFGRSVASIGWSSFWGCNNLLTINYRGNEEQWLSLSSNLDWEANIGSYTVIYNYRGE